MLIMYQHTTNKQLHTQNIFPNVKMVVLHIFIVIMFFHDPIYILAY
jgi:hypothetical protein